MLDVLIELGEALVTELKNPTAPTTWPHTFTPERTFAPELELGDETQEQLNGIRVFVVLPTDEADDEGRELERFACNVQIGAFAAVQQLAGHGDELVTLTGEFRRYFRRWRKTLASGRVATATAHRRLAAIVPTLVKQRGIGASVVQLDVDVFEDLAP